MVIIPFKTLKKLYSSNKEDGEVMGIIHSNNGLMYDRILFSDSDENGKEACKINDIVVGKVSFHTHPKVCYERYSTKIGWPSLDDVLAVIKEEDMKVLLVISLEGVYIIVKKKDSPSSIMQKITDKYKKHFNKKNIDIEEYINKINEICDDCIRTLFFSKETLYKEKDENNIKLDISK